MNNYYILAINSLVKSFSILDSGTPIKFGLTTQTTNTVFADLRRGDKILGFVREPINQVKYIFEVDKIDNNNQICLIKKYEIDEGVLIDSEVERELYNSEIVKIELMTFKKICEQLLSTCLNGIFTDARHYENNDFELGRISTGENILLYGVPGSGKSWTIEHEYCKEGSIVERLVFHPDYTYSEFIGQILPVVSDDGQVRYEFTPGPFTEILRDAYKNPKSEYILIIEEINRGNAPAIFGEVFQLLDRKTKLDEPNDRFPIGTSKYGISNPNIAQIVYGDKTHKVRIPSNLSIIGSMNTSDQNVFTLDTAFQRRWNMRLVKNDFTNVDSKFANAKILDTNVTWKNFCNEINRIIIGNGARMTSAEDKRLGAYFVNAEDLEFNDEMGDLKFYDSLCYKESNGTITGEEKSSLCVICESIKQNRKFPEKVIKYLWDDAFKFNREMIFEVTEYHSLEEVIQAFMYAQGPERFKIFKDNVRDAFMQ